MSCRSNHPRHKRIVIDGTSFKPNKILILVMAEYSRKILAVQVVPQESAEHEFNRLIDHFEFGGTDWDTLQPVSQTFALRLKRPD